LLEYTKKKGKKLNEEIKMTQREKKWPLIPSLGVCMVIRRNIIRGMRKKVLAKRGKK
jgi:hypothetical protein